MSASHLLFFGEIAADVSGEICELLFEEIGFLDALVVFFANDKKLFVFGNILATFLAAAASSVTTCC